MLTLSDTKIKEIADELDCGMKCYYNPVTEEIKSLPDLNSFPITDEEMWADIEDEINSEIDKFVIFDIMPTHDYFQMMVDFAEDIDDVKIQEKLIRALNGKKPFRYFKDQINNSGKYLQQWFDFKVLKYCEWVKEQIEAINIKPNN
jgi:hypothetical protein